MTDVSRSRDSSDSGRHHRDSSVHEPVRDMTDARLVAAVTSGEVDALAEAYDRHGRFVYGLALRLCGQQPAGDMTREVFLALWRSPTTFVKPAASLRATLLDDVHRRATMWVRSDRSRHDGETPIPGGAELQRLELDDADRWQQRLPSKLPKERSAVHLAYFRGYTYKQIATLLGRPKAAVAADLQAQLRQLATQIE